MSQRSSKFLVPIFAAAILATGIFLGSLLNRSNAIGAPSVSELSQAGAKFETVLDLIEQRYVDTINRKEFVHTSINDFLHELDPHSNYFSPEEMKQMMESIDGNFGGVGIRFMIHNDTLAVTNVVPNSPSYMQGVMAGDRIIEVNGKAISGKQLSNEKVMELLKGEPNTRVKVKIKRGAKIVERTITRGVIPLESISCATLMGSQIGYIRLEQFSQTSAEEFHVAATNLKQAGMKKLIFDLRDNGGGVLAAAIDIADEFLPSGKLIVYTQGAHQKKRVFLSSASGDLEDIQVVILINSNTASASEIVSGALQDNDKGTIMGRRSFGKGLVQEDIPLRDGSNVRLTIARYYTPTGRCIQKPYGKGIDYQDDFLQRYENGELYHVDSTVFVDSLKFYTPKGKVVYGGGGIMPDFFIPFDSSGSSYYLSKLRYNLSFAHYTYDLVNRLGRNKWATLAEFKKEFVVTPQLFNDFISYAESETQVKKSPAEIAQSKSLIQQFLKAEVARQLWIEQGYLSCIIDDDKDVQQAFAYLKKSK